MLTCARDRDHRPHGQVERGRAGRLRYGDADDLGTDLGVGERDPEVRRDANDAAAAVEQDPVGRHDGGDASISQAALAEAPRPDAAVADDGGRDTKRVAKRDPLAELELHAADHPAQATGLVPAAVEAERLRVAPGDVLGIAEERGGSRG